jgi:aldose 1-epimerase
MGAFDVAVDWLDAQPTVVLNDVARGRRVRIARRGACVLGIEVRMGGQCIDLADGHRDEGEVVARPGSRFAVLAPFANRVAAARYRFDGIDYDLAPGVPSAARASRHGFVRDLSFAIARLEAHAEVAEVVFATAIDPQPGYPFMLDLAVRYVLDAAGLTMETTLRNLGRQAAPAFAGWHPYFRVGGGSVDAWELCIPAACVVRTGAQFIPLPGEAAYQPLAQAAELDFRQPRRIGPLELNHTYVDLSHDADGRARSRLRDPATGVGVRVWQEGGVMLAYTGDTLERGARTSLALEPMQSLPDAFNRPDCAQAIRLEPGAARTFRCGVEIDLP